jgi:hypothetical protein
MKAYPWLLLFLAVLLVTGCNKMNRSKGRGAKGYSPSPETIAQQEEDEIQANLAQLNPDDSQLAGRQKYCVIEERLLGSVGVPLKILVKGQPVFVCCEGCTTEAEKNPDETLAKLKEFRENAVPSPSK